MDWANTNSEMEQVYFHLVPELLYNTKWGVGAKKMWLYGAFLSIILQLYGYLLFKLNHLPPTI